jgi:hypothetical protein
MAQRRKRKQFRSTSTEIERDMDSYVRGRVRHGPRGKGGKLARRVKKPVGLKRARKRK